MPSPTQGTRGPYAKTAKRRAEILRTAIEVFAEYGYHGTSLREIAARVGLSETGLTHHFGGKSALLAAVIQERDDEDRVNFVDSHFTDIRKLVRQNAQRPGIVQLFALLSAEATVDKHPAHEFFTDRYERLRRQTAEHIRQAQREGSVRTDRDPVPAATVLLALMDGLQIQWLYDRDVDMVAAFDLFFDSWLAPSSSDLAYGDAEPHDGAAVAPGLSWPPPAFEPPGRPTRTLRGDRHYADLTYAAEPGYRPLLLDLTVPPSDEPVPLVVWIHGGAWLMGDRRLMPPTVAAGMIFGALLEAGLAVATVDYRHTLEAPFPAQLQDVKSALRYLRRFAYPLGIDPVRVGVWGESAGGHLAALVGLTATTAELEGDLGVPGTAGGVLAVVDWYGVSDVATLHVGGDDGTSPGPDPVESLLGGPLAANLDRAALASPTTYAHSGAPPFLLIHGTEDAVVPFEQSQLLRDRLLGQHADVTLVAVDGADHIFLGADVEPIVEQSVDFLVRHLTSASGRRRTPRRTPRRAVRT